MSVVQALGKSFLTGTVDATTSYAKDDIRTSIPRFTQDNRAANQIWSITSPPSP
ncbi:hypothetical protein ACVHNB_20225 [Streptomyces sp. YJ-C3]